MSEPIGPGDWVECIDATPSPYYPEHGAPLVVGALYCIEAVVTSRRGAINFALVGVHLPSKVGNRLVFAHWRFRPIRDGQERIVKKERVSA